MALSTEIIDAANDEFLRERLTALRPDHVTQTQVWENMPQLVKADLDGAGASIATVFRYALGQAGKSAGQHSEFVTDSHLTKALSKVFPAPTA